MKLVINVVREGYGTDQVRETMTVGELIEALQEYDEDAPVYLGNDSRSYGWYTYGGITWDKLCEVEEEDEEEDEEDEEDEKQEDK